MKKTLFAGMIGIVTILLLLAGLYGKEHYRTTPGALPNDTLHAPMVCAIDTNTAYYIFWEKLFLTRNQVWEEYYNNHIASITSLPVI